MAEGDGDEPMAPNSDEKGTASQQQQQQAPAQDSGNGNSQQAANSSQQQQQQDGSEQQQQQQGLVPKQPKKLWAGPRINLPPPIADAGDGKILLLFDLNGVLTEKTPPRVEGKFIKRDHIVRPHIGELLRLYPHFRIGVFSSATIRTVNTALDTLYAALQRSTAHTGIEGLLLPKKLDLFSVICYRDHCQPDPYWKSRDGGKDHDTIKPLARMGFNLNRTVLVDNDDYKAADGEHENMLHVPHWEQTEETNRDFPLMVQLILRHLKGIEGDVRPHLRLIEQQLKQLRTTDPSRITKATDRAKARALTAATAKSWAGDQELRVALAAEEVSAPGIAASVVDRSMAAAAAAAFANAAGLEAEGGAALGLRSPQMQQRMRLFALQGMKVMTAAELDACPPEARKLVQLLSRHTKAAAKAAGADAAAAGAEAAAAGAKAGAAAAAAAAATDAHKLLIDAGDSLAAAAYSQHSLLLLFLCVWGCNLALPENTFSLSQLIDLLQSRGWPTQHVASILEAMLRAGTLKVVDTPQQQQQQQKLYQQWVWPDESGTWPAPGVPVPSAAAAAAPKAAAGSSSSSSSSGSTQPWVDCLLRLPDPRSKQLMKSVEEVTSFLATATPTAITEVLGALEDNNKQQLGIKVQRPPSKAPPKYRGAQKGAPPRVPPEQIAASWSSMINAAIRDLTTGPGTSGATADQLLRFIQGLEPNLQLQLLGSSSSKGRQQQVQRLQQQLLALQALVKAVPARIKHKREKSLLGPPFGVFAIHPLPPFTPSGKPSAKFKPDAAAATALTRYTVGVVPNADAVGRSIRVLQAGARAQSAEAVAEAIAAAQIEQQQQLDEHLKAQGGAPVHSLLHQLKPPVVAALSLSSHLNLPPLVSQWLLECQQLDDAQQQQQQQQQPQQQIAAAAANGAAAEGAAAAGKRARGEGEVEAAGVLAAAAAAAAAAAGDGSSPQKKPKLTPQQQQQQQQQDDAVDADAHADLDALYEAEEQQRQEEAAVLEAEDALAAAELAAVDEAAADPAAAAAAVESALDLLLPDADGDGDDNGGDEGEGGEGEGEESEENEENEQGLWEAREEDGDDGDQGFGGDGGDDEGGDDDGGFDGGAAGGSGGSSGGGNGGDWDMDQDGDGQGEGDADMGDGQGDGDGEYAGGGGGSSGEAEADAAMNDGPGDGDDQEFLYADDSDQDREHENEVGYEMYSEDDSEAWATDDEADGQLQLGITGLGGEEDGAAAAAAADDGVDGAAAAADAAAATAAAMQRAAAGAGAQVRGRGPLYGKLLAALNNAREGDAAAGGSNGSNGSNGGHIAHQMQMQQLLKQPSRLHRELLQFAAAAAPSAVERLVVESAMQQLQEAADRAWPGHGPEALLFGSQATGLALPGSDLDVVLLGVPGCPMPRKTDKGFSIEGRGRVSELLWKFAGCLRAARRGRKTAVQVINAKVPILKGTLLVDIPQHDLLSALALDSKHAAQSLAAAAARHADRHGSILRVELQVDISIGISDSQAAVRYLQRQVQTLPPLRPLMLAAKAVIREAGLNEVFTGGLGSYTLALMVISHLQAEGVADAASSAMLPIDRSTSNNHQADIAQHLQQTAAAAAQAAAAAAGAGAGAGGNIHSCKGDLGLLLHGFFLRFGALFDYTSEAVAVNQGGVVAKPWPWVQEQRRFLLSVEDPAMPGRDMSSGSYAIRDVKVAFLRIATSLRELTPDWEAPTAAAKRRIAAAELKHSKTLQQVAAAAAAAVLGCSQRINGMNPAAVAAPQQQQQQQQRQAGSKMFQVVEDRKAWASVQADGQSQSLNSSFGSGSTPAAAAAAAAAPGRVFFSSRGPVMSKKEAAALLKDSEAMLKNSIQQQLGMLGSVMDLHAAVGRGVGADGRRSEQARHASLRGQARSKGHTLQHQQQQQQQHGGGPKQQQKQRPARPQPKNKTGLRAKLAARREWEELKHQNKQQRGLRVRQDKLAGIGSKQQPFNHQGGKQRKEKKKKPQQQQQGAKAAKKLRNVQKQQKQQQRAAEKRRARIASGAPDRKRARVAFPVHVPVFGGGGGGGGGYARAAAGGGGRGWAHAD